MTTSNQENLHPTIKFFYQVEMLSHTLFFFVTDGATKLARVFEPSHFFLASRIIEKFLNLPKGVTMR